MKFSEFISGVFFFIFICFCSCENKNKVQLLGPSLIELDVTKDYPEKEINLEDIANIEYVCLETHDDFLFTGGPYCITENYIVLYNKTNGDIVTFNRKGKPVFKFNHKGEGPNEYGNWMFGIIYDENREEYFVMGYGKVLVYSKEGSFLRNLPLPQNSYLLSVDNFNKDLFLCYDKNNKFSTTFFLFSKDDGNIMEKIDIPYEKKLEMSLRRQDGEMAYRVSGTSCNIIKNEKGFLLTEHSNDTIYLYTPEKILRPVLTRTPPIQTMEPMTYLNGFVETPQYFFLTTVDVVYNWETQQGFDGHSIMINKKNGEINRQKLVWNDFKNRPISITPEMVERTGCAELGFFTLNIVDVQDALEEGRLSGKLKDLAETLEEDSNNIFVFLHFK